MRYDGNTEDLWWDILTVVFANLAMVFTIAAVDGGKILPAAVAWIVTLFMLGVREGWFDG